MNDDRDRQDEEAARQRTRDSAQAAARDLAKMGIDPQSLGLAPEDRPAPAPRQADPTGGRPAPRPADRPGDRQRDVIPLRPDLEQAPAGAGRPAPPYDATRGGPVAVPRPAVPGAEPEPAEPGEVEQMLARTAARKPSPRSPGRLARTLARGIFTPDAAEAAGIERELVGAARRRQTERRVVSFVSGKGGVGTTSVLCGVGAAFAGLRDDRSVLLDVQAGSPPLSGLLSVERPITASALLRATDGSPVPTTASGLGVVDGAPWEQPLQRQQLPSVLDRLGADHTFALVDVGRDPGEAAHAALARSDQVVIVTTAGEHGLQALSVAGTRVRQSNPVAAERAVVVVVCPYGESHRRAFREITARVPVSPARVVVVPADQHLASGSPFDPAMVSVAVREAMLEVAAVVAVAGAPRPGGRLDRGPR